MNIISSSCGNDSVALIQWARENDIDDVAVTYWNPARLRAARDVMDTMDAGFDGRSGC